jgi:hypothetical protein
MTAEKIAHNGAWRVCAVVTNGSDRWLESRTYYSYNKAQALANYRQTVLSMGWRMV